MGNESGIVNYARALKFVFTVEYDINVKSVKDLKFANIIKNETIVKYAIHRDTYRLYVEHDEKRY